MAYVWVSLAEACQLGAAPQALFVVLRLLEVCCCQWHVGVPCIFLKISKAQQCLWRKNWEGYWCWVCGLAVTDTCSPLPGGRAGTRLPFCMVALVTMALVKWRCIGKSPQWEDTVSKGAQQRQMKHLLSPQPWKGPSSSPALRGLLRNQDLSLGYFTPQVLHFGSVFTARVWQSFAATAFRVAQGGRPCEQCCPQCARCWVRTVQRCRWWGLTSFHRAQSTAVLLTEVPHVLTSADASSCRTHNGAFSVCHAFILLGAVYITWPDYAHILPNGWNKNGTAI